MQRLRHLSRTKRMAHREHEDQHEHAQGDDHAHSTMIGFAR